MDDALANTLVPLYTLTLIVHGPAQQAAGTGQLRPNLRLWPGPYANRLEAMGTSVPQASVAVTVTVYRTFLEEQLVTMLKMPTKVPAVPVGVLSSGVATAAQACADAGKDINDRHTRTSTPLKK